MNLSSPCFKTGGDPYAVLLVIELRFARMRLEWGQAFMSLALDRLFMEVDEE